ncbi:collagen alpha-1(I) chain-like [Talpa occidentalis]|uniref:collagen alpha-1(I) chain-like n=1 Tax=Talpa occidentalis TaxID=50954 RepID=UPI00189031BD|nr:collagen alpha-1(I) chain-like [Talpa occidentalis]
MEGRLPGSFPGHGRLPRKQESTAPEKLPLHLASEKWKFRELARGYKRELLLNKEHLDVGHAAAGVCRPGCLPPGVSAARGVRGPGCPRPGGVCGPGCPPPGGVRGPGVLPPRVSRPGVCVARGVPARGVHGPGCPPPGKSPGTRAAGAVGRSEAAGGPSRDPMAPPCRPLRSRRWGSPWGAPDRRAGASGLAPARRASRGEGGLQALHPQSRLTPNPPGGRAGRALRSGSSRGATPPRTPAGGCAGDAHPGPPGRLRGADLPASGSLPSGEQQEGRARGLRRRRPEGRGGTACSESPGGCRGDSRASSSCKGGPDQLASPAVQKRGRQLGVALSKQAGAGPSGPLTHKARRPRRLRPARPFLEPGSRRVQREPTGPASSGSPRASVQREPTGPASSGSPRAQRPAGAHGPASSGSPRASVQREPTGPASSGSPRAQRPAGAHGPSVQREPTGPASSGSPRASVQREPTGQRPAGAHGPSVQREPTGQRPAGAHGPSIQREPTGPASSGSPRASVQREPTGPASSGSPRASVQREPTGQRPAGAHRPASSGSPRAQRPAGAHGPASSGSPRASVQREPTGLRQLARHTASPRGSAAAAPRCFRSGGVQLQPALGIPSPRRLVDPFLAFREPSPATQTSLSLQPLPTCGRDEPRLPTPTGAHGVTCALQPPPPPRGLRHRVSAPGSSALAFPEQIPARRGLWGLQTSDLGDQPAQPHGEAPAVGHKEEEALPFQAKRTLGPGGGMGPRSPQGLRGSSGPVGKRVDVAGSPEDKTDRGCLEEDGRPQRTPQSHAGDPGPRLLTTLF